MKRFRQFRTTPEVRDHYADVEAIAPNDLILPYFVIDGHERRERIETMPGVYRFTIDELLYDLEETVELGIVKVLIFGVIANGLKDELGTQAYADDNLVARAVAAIKAKFPALTVITDVCLCEYTDHGHCGLICNCDVDNDSTLPLLAEMAATHARAGADFVAPSAMMDGQVEAIRQKLDSEGLTTKILAYSAKYASAFYGPFRNAANSSPKFGDRKTYQMDYRTKYQAIDEMMADISEGADWVMVKPAMAYLDVVYKARQEFIRPIVAYQVSGEYSMLKHGAAVGLFDEHSVFAESLVAIRRAGAKYIITYYAKQYAKKL